MSDSIAADAEAAGFPTTFDSNTAAGRALDRMSVYEYIERRIPGRASLAARGAPRRRLRHRVRRRFDRAVGAQPDLPARLPAQCHSLSVFGESDEKFHIRGGNQQLPEAIARYLGGDVVRMGQRLARIDGNRRRPVQSHVRASQRRARGGRRLRGPGAAVCRAARARHLRRRASTR